MPPSNVRLRARRWQGYMDVMPHIRELQVSEALKRCPTILWVVESRYGISYLTEPERINVRSHFAGNFYFFYIAELTKKVTFNPTWPFAISFALKWVLKSSGFLLKWLDFADKHSPNNGKYDCNFRKLGRHPQIRQISPNIQWDSLQSRSYVQTTVI